MHHHAAIRARESKATSRSHEFIVAALMCAASAPVAYTARRDTAGCIRWQNLSAAPPSGGGLFAAAPAGGSALCRWSASTNGTWTDSFASVERLLPVGTFNSVTGQCVIPGAVADPSALSEVQLAVVQSSECDVWWRYVSEDVIPPLPELTLQFGASESHDTRYGICRTRSVEPQLGTLIFNGPAIGHCVVPSDGNRPQMVLRGGSFDTVEARVLGGCINDPQQANVLRSSLKSKLDAYLLPEDRAQIANISGHRYESLEAGMMSTLGSCDLAAVLSAARFIPHDLNRVGLVRSKLQTCHTSRGDCVSFLWWDRVLYGISSLIASTRQGSARAVPTHTQTSRHFAEMASSGKTSVVSAYDTRVVPLAN